MSGAAAALALAAGAPGRPHTEPGAGARAVAATGRPLFDLAWRAPSVRTGLYRRVKQSFGGPLVVPRLDLVVVGTGEGAVLGLSLVDGRLRWRHEHGAPFESTPALVPTRDGERVALGARDGALVALDPRTGALVWQTQVDGEVRAAPRPTPRGLLVATAANRVLLLRPESGAVVWSQGRPPPTGLTVEGHSRPLLAGDRVFATFADGYAMGIDVASGAVAWARPLSLRGGAFVDADADPVAVGDTVVVASYTDGIYALARADGQTVWNVPAPAVTALALAPGARGRQAMLLAGSAEGYVWGLRPADGALMWRTRAPRGAISRLAVHAGVAACTAGHYGLVLLDARHGEPLQVSGVGGDSGGDPDWEDDALAFVGGSGHVALWRSRAAPDS